jgi:hypothetical protein
MRVIAPILSQRGAFILDAFYQTVTSFCFTLLGLWWAVIQFRYEAWMLSRERRRLAHMIHLSFLLPGVMSLGAMLAGEQPLIWRGVFVVVSLFGLGTTTLALAGGARQAMPARYFLVAQSCAACLYAIMLFFALFPAPARGLGLEPLQLEGLFLTLLVTVGVNIAWAALTSPA